MDFYQIWYRGPLADVMKYAEFFVEQFRGVNVQQF